MAKPGCLAYRVGKLVVNWRGRLHRAHRGRRLGGPGVPTAWPERTPIASARLSHSWTVVLFLHRDCLDIAHLCTYIARLCLDIAQARKNCIAADLI
jgi:hypothetical protein